MTSQFSLRAGMALALSVLVGLPLGASTASATPLSIDLCAVTGTMTLPGQATPVPIWGYVDCTASPTSPPALTRPGGPTLAYNQGEAVLITLHNNLSVSTGLAFPGLPQPPDRTGVAPGGTKVYGFTVNKPGTFLYQAALLPKSQYQVAMGLYGAMSVLPTGGGKAYADTVPLSQDSSFTAESTLVLSEIDPALNRTADPATFNMRNFAPRYGLINGAVHPNTAPIPAVAGDKVLLRYVNAGLKLHSMSALGVRQNVIAYDGNELRYPHKVVAETFGPGQTTDVIATVPLSAAAGSRYAIYDGSLSLHNSSAGNGGMLTFISVAGSTVPTGTPITSGVTLTPGTTNGTVPAAGVAVAATFTPAATASEYFVDVVGAPGTGTPLTNNISTADLAPLSAGIHVVYVHGQNANGWGPVASAPLNLDKAGPATSGLSLVPAISNGVGSVVLNASGSDAATGGANVVSGNYTIVGGAPGTLSPNGPVAVTTALKATIPVGTLSEGTHDISVTSTDSLGNVGAAIPVPTITLTVDKTGPVGTPGSISATPNPSNGLVGVSSGVPAVRVKATFTDPLSNIAGAEGFIDTVGANGTGFVFTPSDGVWGPKVSTGTNQDVVFADIPLATIAALANGNHAISVHAKDAAGNWGAAISVVLLVDKTAPTFTAALSTSSVPSGTPSVTLNLTGSDNAGGTGIAAGEYWFGTATIAVGTGTAFTGMAPTIPVSTLTPGTYTIRVRLRDGVGNWSGIQNVTLVVTYADAIFSNGFETAGSPWGWSSTSTNTVARLNRTAGAALVGGFGLQAQGNNNNYVQWNFPTGTAVSTYDAKFSFRPNGNTSTGNDIFVARNGNTTVFRVRYRMNAGTPQVQIQVGTSNANTAWTNLTGGTTVNTIQVVWQANVAGGLKLYVNGVLVGPSLNTANNTIGSVRLGSVTNGGSPTLMYFDNFASKRLTTPLL